MNAEIISGLVRHFLTALGSYWVTTGLVGKDDVEAIAGGASVLVAVLWSILHKKGMQTGATVPLVFLGGMIFFATGCTTVKTEVTRTLDVRPGSTNILSEKVTTKAYSLFDSAQKIQAAQAKQSKASQAAGFTGLEQEASSTNLNGLVESIASGIVKGMK